jgi:TonB family protein
MCRLTLSLLFSLSVAFGAGDLGADDEEQVSVEDAVIIQIPYPTDFSSDVEYTGFPICDGPIETIWDRYGYVEVRYAIDTQGRITDISIVESVPNNEYDAAELEKLVLATLRNRTVTPPPNVIVYRTERHQFCSRE